MRVTSDGTVTPVVHLSRPEKKVAPRISPAQVQEPTVGRPAASAQARSVPVGAAVRLELVGAMPAAKGVPDTTNLIPTIVCEKPVRKVTAAGRNPAIWEAANDGEGRDPCSHSGTIWAGHRDPLLHGHPATCLTALAEEINE